MTGRPVDLRLYLVTDPRLPEPDLHRRVMQAVEGGATLVQLRCKGAASSAVAEMAARLRRLLDPKAIPLIVNDDVLAAIESGAAGVHLGQSDMPPAEARRMLGPEAVVGLSLERLTDVSTADAAVIDYVAASPVFLTSTKADIAPPLGIEGVAAIRAALDLPLVGIGGIDASNAGAVIAAGADGVALISAILRAEDPAAAAASIRREVDAALAARAASARA